MRAERAEKRYLVEVSDRPKRPSPEPAGGGRRALQVTLRLDGRPLETRLAGPGKDLLPDTPLPLEARPTGRGFELTGPDGAVPVGPSDVASVRHGRLEAEVREIRVRRFSRFALLQGDIVLPVIMLATTLLVFQLNLLFKVFVHPAQEAGGAEPSPEYLARLLEEQFDGKEQGVVAKRMDRPKSGDAIESFYLQAGHDGPKTKIGGGKNVGDRVKDGDVRPQPEVVDAPEPVEEAIADAGGMEAQPDVPPATPVEEREAGEEQPVAVHVTEGWGLTDWYDTQDARDDAREIERQLKLARELLRLDPNDPNGLSLRAYYEYLAMDFGAAKRTYEKFTTLYPEEPAGWNNLALVYKREGDYAEEEKLYRIALALSPDDDHALNNLAVCLAHQGRYDEALAAMEKLEVLTPDDPYADLHRAKIYAAMGKEDRAYRFLQKSLSGMRKLDTLHNIEFRQDIRVDPVFAKMREQDRFHDLLNRFYGEQPGGWWGKKRGTR